jgi:hypothetical protein
VRSASKGHIGSGARLFEDVPAGPLERVSVIEARGVAHLKYRAG